MAEVVQFRMERMVEELDDLERRGLFTRAEIADIVRRRREFEFHLNRPSPLKQDFLAYIEYEGKLDKLRNLRKKQKIGESKGEGKKWRKSVSDVAGVLRILDVYRMAVMRFKGDLELWFRYLEFCREKRHRQMKKGLAQAIRYHPEVPGLWIYAAAWQFDQNLNVVAARALMQSGLRACPKSEDLWIEYLRTELTYLNKLKARKVALGENVRMLDRNCGEAKQWKEENKDIFMTMSVNEESEDVEGEDLFWQQGSMILQTIYQGAVDALPSSMSLRKRFLEILDTVDLAHVDRLKEEILEDLKKQFSHDEHYCDWIARLQISSPGKSSPMTKTETLAKLNKAVEVSSFTSSEP